jgi:solute:Na+ symporter, SSS family
MTVEISDLIVIFLYVLLVLYLGFIVAAKKDKSDISVKSERGESENFILAGRKLTLPLFIASLVATWYGSILGVGEFVYNSGIVAWLCFSFPYYIAAGLFGAFIAEKIRNSSAHTIPEQIKGAYGAKASYASSIIILVITIPAAYILMLGVLIQMFFDISLWSAIIAGTVLSMAYLFTGGFKADVLTNLAQFVFMYIGFGALIVFTFVNFGFYSEITHLLPETHLKLTGDFSWQYILVWFVIAMQTFVDPSFHQRCAAARTPKAAKNGIFISILFWMLFDFMTITAGLYATGLLEIDNPMMAFPMLGEMVLPPIWKGIFIIALLSTVMSTLDSYAFLSGSTIGNDLIGNLLPGTKQKIGTRKLTQIGLVITGIIGIGLAILVPSAVELIYLTASIAVPGLIIPLVLSYSTKYYIMPKNALIIMISASMSAFIWVIVSKSIGQTVIEPMFVGILISIVIAIFSIKQRELI